MASGQLYNGSILCSFLSENNLLFRRTVLGLQIIMLHSILLQYTAVHNTHTQHYPVIYITVSVT